MIEQLSTDALGLRCLLKGSAGKYSDGRTRVVERSEAEAIIQEQIDMRTRSGNIVG